MFRSSHWEVFCVKDVLRNFAKFPGKHLCQSLFFNKVAGLMPKGCNFIKKETLAHDFSRKFGKISKNTLNYIIPLMAASGSLTRFWIRPCALKFIQYTRGNNSPKTVLKGHYHGCVSINFTNFFRTTFEKTLQENYSCVVLSQLQKIYLQSS